jgi:hypothetical protein
VLLRNLGNGQFVDVAMAVGADSIMDARAVAVADFDNDGDMDMVVNGNPGMSESIAPVLYRNNIGARQNWLEVDLTGSTVNRDAAGSEVVIELADGTEQFRHVLIGSAYASQSSLRLHFGLGKHEEIKKLTVNWIGPRGGTDVFFNIPSNRVISITQGASGEKGSSEMTMLPETPATAPVTAPTPAPAPAVETSASGD